MSSPFAYDTIRLTARPPRPLLGYDPGPSWTAAASEAFRWLSSVWGGAAGAIVPLSDTPGPTPADRRLLNAVRTFDPDVVVYRPVLISDLDDDALRRLVDPSDAHRIALLRETRPNTPTSVRQRGWELGVLRWCAAKQPYDELDDTKLAPHFPAAHDDELPPHPFTSASAVAGGNARATEFVVDHLDPKFALMVVTRSGMSPSGRTAASITPGDHDLRGLAEWAVTGTVTPGRLPCVEVRASAVDAGSATTELLLAAMPLPATGAGVSWLQPPMHRYSPSVLVVGDSAEDHALAVVADRTLNVSAWVPASLLADGSATGDAVRYAVAVFLQRSRRGNVRRPTLVTSTTLDFDAIRALIDDLGGRLEGVHVIAAEDLKFEHIKVLADATAASQPSTHPATFDDGTVTLLTAVEPPMPAALVGHDDGSWMVDVRPGKAAAPPPRATLGSSAMLGPEDQSMPFPETLVRASRHGLTFWSQRQGLILTGALPGSSYARPQLRFPGAADTVAALASAAQMTARPSVAGERAMAVAEMWGGTAALADDLQGPVRALLQVLAGAGANGGTPWGCIVDHRNHVTFNGANRLLGGDVMTTRRILDRLLVAGAVRRGLILGCGRCSSVTFYKTAAITDTFACDRCSHVNSLTRARWRSPDAEPDWFYELDPLVARLIEQNGDVPLVAATTILKRHPEPGSSTYETEFCRHDQSRSWIEVDFACVVAGRLYLGEAKSNGTLPTGKRNLPDTVQRLATLAVALSVDHLVLATSTAQWAEGQVEAVRTAVRSEADHWGAPVPTVEILSIALGDSPSSDDSRPTDDQPPVDNS